MTHLTSFFGVMAALLVAWIVLDHVMPRLLRLLGPALPDDVVGRDGWLLDTRAGTGIFDRGSSV